MRRPRGLSILFGLALAACATSPAYRPSAVQVPPAFHETARDTTTQAAVPPGRRRAGYGCPRRAARLGADRRPGEPGRLLARAGRHHARPTDGQMLRANLDVQSAFARVRGARAARTETALDLAPTVTVGRQLHPAADLERRVPDWGRRVFPTRTSGTPASTRRGSWICSGACGGTCRRKAPWSARRTRTCGTCRWSLTAELARTYFELRGAQERLNVARRNGENQRRTLDVTQQRLDAGRGTAFDTERARTQLGFTLASIPGLEAQVAASQYAIGVLIARPPAGWPASWSRRRPCRRCRPTWRWPALTR